MDAPQAALVAHYYPAQVHLGLDTMLSKPISFASSRVLVCIYKLAGKSEIHVLAVWGWRSSYSHTALGKNKSKLCDISPPAQTALNRRSAIRWPDAIAHAVIDALTRLVH